MTNTLLRKFIILCVALFCGATLQITYAQHSVARKWNEVLLNAIRNDFARPTVHARNLYHASLAMYDAWAVYDEKASTIFLNHHWRGFYSPFSEIDIPENSEERKQAQEEAISYAAYRLLRHRFKGSPGENASILEFELLMDELGYDPFVTTLDYSSGSPAAVGNYIAQQIISFGLQDGSNELNKYINRHYSPVNNAFPPGYPGNPGLVDPNRWQPLQFTVFIDQSGQTIGDGVPKFLGPEWGEVVPFCLQEKDLKKFNRNGYDYWVYHDPGNPAYLEEGGGGTTQDYLWSFALVSVWSSHLSSTDETLWDISPAAIGNISNYPTTLEGLRDFYNFFEGGDPSEGYTLNPFTGEPYATQFVKRGDYARVLAEFWADGPSSETPPGHWFTILNYVNDHPLLEKRFMGEGEVIDDLEWDIKSYLVLGGTMHDVAITVWGIKGWYDYVRPISAIRSMAARGQSSLPASPNYHPAGIPLFENFIELIGEDDPLAGVNQENVNKIKLKAWRGPTYINNPEVDEAHVDWILAENWWPYQRPSFVTPPFAGYVSGHSTYSRAAAETLSLLTGSEYFPGGLGEFVAPKNEFLVFEEGPSEELILQWAKYKDASDQCSLSRIWGGIHPPVDDMPGRHLGSIIGPEAFEFAIKYFNGEVQDEIINNPTKLRVYPVPAVSNQLVTVQVNAQVEKMTIQLVDLNGKIVASDDFFQPIVQLDVSSLSSGIYILQVTGSNFRLSNRLMVIK